MPQFSELPPGGARDVWLLDRLLVTNMTMMVDPQLLWGTRRGRLERVCGDHCPRALKASRAQALSLSQDWYEFRIISVPVLGDTCGDHGTCHAPPALDGSVSHPHARNPSDATVTAKMTPNIKCKSPT